MNASFSASAYLVKTEKGVVVGEPANRASFSNAYDPYDPTGSGYAINTRGAATFSARTEKKAIPRKRFRPPGDGRFFDGHH
jgi:hypothetical protein